MKNTHKEIINLISNYLEEYPEIRFTQALSFLLGSVDTKEDKVETPTTAEELFHAAMDQEVLNLIK